MSDSDSDNEISHKSIGFGMLGDSSSENSDSEADASPKPKANAFALMGGSSSSESDQDSEEEAEAVQEKKPSTPVATQSKKNKKKGRGGHTVNDDDDDWESALAGVSISEKGKQGKKNKKGSDRGRVNEVVEDDFEAILEAEFAASQTVSTTTNSKKGGKKNKKKGGKGKQAAAVFFNDPTEEEDWEALLEAEFNASEAANEAANEAAKGGAPEVKPVEPVVVAPAVVTADAFLASLSNNGGGGKKGKNKKKKGKGSRQAQNNDDDWESALADASVGNQTVNGSTDLTAKEIPSQEQEGKSNAADAAAAFLAASGLEGEEKTAGKKKKKKKKGKGGQNKANEPKKETAMAKRIRLAQEAKKAEEERLAAEAEKLRLQQEEEERKIREEEERKQRAKEAKKARREQLRREGKLKSKSELERERKAAIALKQMQDAGLIEANTGHDGGGSSERRNRKDYRKRGGNRKPKFGARGGQKSLVAVDEAERENARIEADKAAAAAAAAAKKAEEEAAAAAAAAALEESDEAVDDWEAEDWEEEADAAPEATIAEATSTSVVPAVLVADDGAEDWEAEDWEADEVALPTALVDERPTFSDEEEEDIADAAAAAAKKAATSAGEAEKSQSPKGQGRRAAAKAKHKRNAREVESSSGAGERKGGDTSSEETGGSSDDSDDSDLDRNEIRERERAEAMSVAREARLERRRFAFQNRNPDELRSPVVCVLGHVDTGKTKLLDKIRRTNVQEGEAGGITQQIGATFFPMQNLRKQTDKLSRELGLTTKLPGLLVIDTPGHESFGNLRSRGSNLCDIAILVVDLMHGLEPQTIESLNLLRKARTPFIVALNKIDRCLDWNVSPNATVRSTLARQKDYTVQDFDSRVTKVITEFAEQGLNACLYYDNQDFNQYISLVPTSAHTGEGIPDLLTLLVQLSQRRMGKKLQIADYVTATLLEVKSIPGHGMTIDLCLLNGTLHEGDTIVVCGLTGPITTSIRALMTPQPMKELRVKGAYQHHKSIRAAMGVKIAAHNLEHAVAGTQVMVVTEEDMLEEVQDAVQGDLRDAMAALATEPEGVYVQASTLGALEALMEFLRTSNIPVCGVNIGPVHKRDVVKASTMVERRPELAMILAFDVKVSQEAREQALELGVRLFTADIIYHLFDQFTKYMDEWKAEQQAKSEAKAVFPCVLRILPEYVFNKKNPIVLGVEVSEGILKVGTPLCIPDRGNLVIGKVTSIEANRLEVPLAKKGANVAIKIEPTAEQSYITYGRQFDHTSALVSLLSRESIDALKKTFKHDLVKEDWLLVIKLKKMFKIA